MNTVEIELDDGRRVRLTQADGGGPIGYALGDDRFADGWRPLDDGDEIGRLVDQIAAEQAARAEASSPEPDPADDPAPDIDLEDGPDDT